MCTLVKGMRQCWDRKKSLNYNVIGMRGEEGGCSPTRYQKKKARKLRWSGSSWEKDTEGIKYTVGINGPHISHTNISASVQTHTTDRKTLTYYSHSSEKIFHPSAFWSQGKKKSQRWPKRTKEKLPQVSAMKGTVILLCDFLGILFFLHHKRERKRRRNQLWARQSLSVSAIQGTTILPPSFLLPSPRLFITQEFNKTSASKAWR